MTEDEYRYFSHKNKQIIPHLKDLGSHWSSFHPQTSDGAPESLRGQGFFPPSLAPLGRCCSLPLPERGPSTGGLGPRPVKGAPPQGGPSLSGQRGGQTATLLLHPALGTPGTLPLHTEI